MEIETARTATRQLEDARAEIAGLEKSAADLEVIIQAKQDEINTLTTVVRQEEQLAVDAAHGLDNMGAACGPNCHMHQLKAEEALKRIATIRRTLTNPTTERIDALKRRDALTAQMIPLKQKAEAATNAASKPGPRSGTMPDLETTLRNLIAIRDQLGIDPSWERVLLARHPKRPHSLDYIQRLFTDFHELHGDRLFSDDHAIVAGMAWFDDKPVMVIGQQKGRDTKQKVFRNWGMPKPEGYRKAMRVMELAAKFNRPIVAMVDTPGADRKSTRLNSSHSQQSRMPSSA